MDRIKPAAAEKIGVWHILFLIVGVTWLFWIPAGLLNQAEPAPPVLILHYLGGLVPTIVALLVLGLTTDAAGWRAFWLRVFDVSRITGTSYLVIFLTAPLITVLSAGIDRLLGGHGLALEAAARFIESPLAFFPFALFLLLFGPFVEEIAWRGVVLDRLIRRGALIASVIIGSAWIIWHLPLFTIEGSYQAGLGVGTLAFWLFQLGLLPQSAIMTWLYTRNQQSILTAIFFHWMVNLTGELFALSPRAEVLSIGLWWLLAIIIALASGWVSELSMQK